ncbi:hypothetical protein VP01_2063g2 [Puccinia sorghi]|uniref:Uncharacterized protein n=1 Tax=Puccinia sorghi TaxID=27349 RepID=A0A0L6VAS3_9BASI|nr:hypothetical protein VP01_2063g2 [Puccinia sorghi]
MYINVEKKFILPNFLFSLHFKNCHETLTPRGSRPMALLKTSISLVMALTWECSGFFISFLTSGSAKSILYNLNYKMKGMSWLHRESFSSSQLIQKSFTMLHELVFKYSLQLVLKLSELVQTLRNNLFHTKSLKVSAFSCSNSTNRIKNNQEKHHELSSVIPSEVLESKGGEKKIVKTHYGIRGSIDFLVLNRDVSMALSCKFYHFTFLNNLLLVLTCVDAKLKNQPDALPKSSCYHPSNKVRYSFHLLKKSYTTFAHPIFLEIIFEFQKNVKNPYENVVINAQGLMFCLEIIITHISYVKALLVSLYQFFQSMSIRTLHKTHTTLPTNKNFLASQNFSYLVGGASLKHPPTKTHTRAWKANQISSQFSLFLPQKMSHSCFHSPPSLSLNLPRLLCRVFDFVFA